MKGLVRRNEFGIFIALLVMIAVVAALNPRAFFQAYSINLWVFGFSLIGLLAIGETFVILTGGIDLAPGSLIALTGVAAAMLTNAFGGMNPWLAIGLSTAITLVLGVIVGFYHSFYINRLGVPPFIITLGTLIIARGVAELMTHGSTVTGMPGQFTAIGSSGSGSVPGLPFLPIAGVVFAVVAIAAHYISVRTSLGRHIYAVGGNLQAAHLSGVNVAGVRAFCYAASGLLAAVVGVIYASNVNSGDPKAGFSYEMTAIAAVVIGGTSLAGGVGTIVGTVLGAAIMGLLPLGLTFIGVESWWQSITTGVVVVLAVTLDSLRRIRRERQHH